MARFYPTNRNVIWFTHDDADVLIDVIDHPTSGVNVRVGGCVWSADFDGDLDKAIDYAIALREERNADIAEML